ncbi:MAG: hypothetical protein A3J38_10550 [Gammaproteobacteria bacterium RIFCSPHIGHO2_12_FULL_45_9]|nr:MAG: hypothetical protein A3J38_10550 [Gammaproteobacteria bacterium RIFCSPHIGHO2_12_FULL_45_9]
MDIKHTLHELKDGWHRRELWLLLGKRDVHARYRGSFIGVFWIMLNVALVGGVMGLLYSHILHESPTYYVPYLLVGFTTWNLLSTLITDSCRVFSSNAVAMKEIQAPNTLYVFRIIWKNVLTFLYGLSVYGLACILLKRPPSWSMLLSIPALLLIILNGLWVGLLLGSLCSRFRDVEQLVKSGLRFLFFVTPVLWVATHTGWRAELALWNPLYYFLELVRAPLLGQSPAYFVWLTAISISLIGWIVTLCLYSRYSRRLSSWI